MSEQLFDYLEMGGYGTYIWPAYAVAGIIMLWLLWSSVRELHKAQAEFDQLQPPPASAVAGSYRVIKEAVPATEDA